MCELVAMLETSRLCAIIDGLRKLEYRGLILPYRCGSRSTPVENHAALREASQPRGSIRLSPRTELTELDHTAGPPRPAH